MARKKSFSKSITRGIKRQFKPSRLLKSAVSMVVHAISEELSKTTKKRKSGKKAK